MIKQTFSVLKVFCPFKNLEGANIEECRNNCSYFNGLQMDDKGNITSIDCIGSEIPTINCHVNGFIMKGKQYRAREYDENIDGPLKNSDDYCEKCCFNKLLSNNNEICLLRSGVRDSKFICYEGEIWEEIKEE